MANHPHDFDENAPDPLLGDEGGPQGRGFVTEFLRKAAVASIGAFFMTEEGVRNLAGQLKLPTEAMGFLLSQVEKTKDDLARVITEEVRRFLQSEKLRNEFVKLVAGMSLEVTANIRLVPDKDGGKDKRPDVSVTSVSAKPHGKKHKA